MPSLDNAELRLPRWLTRGPDGAWYVDPDLIYPAIFRAIGVADGDVDQYWIEIAYQIAKLEVDRVARINKLHPDQTGRGLVKHIMAGGGRKRRWGLKNWPDKHVKIVDGREVPGWEQATKGKHARQYYVRLRGHMP